MKIQIVLNIEELISANYMLQIDIQLNRPNSCIYKYPDRHKDRVYEGGSESSVRGGVTLLIDMIDCCIIP